MLRTKQAPWTARRVARAEMRNVLQTTMLAKACWRVGKYLGSMLFFDFGEKITLPSMRGGVIHAGEATLGIQNVYWEIILDEQIVTDSDRVDEESVQQLMTLMKGSEVVDLTTDRENNFLNLLFSNGATLKLDTANRYATPDCIAELTLHDGRIYTITPRGSFVLSDRISIARSNTSSMD